jgi:replicative DNA helicase
MDLTNRNTDKKNRRKPAPDLSTMIYGKVPPQAKDFEEQVLGQMMMDAHFGTTEAAYDVKQMLSPEEFYVDAHQKICRAIFTLLDENKQPEILFVVNQLRKTEELDMVGGPYYVTKLTDKVVGSTQMLHYCKVIKQLAIARKLIDISGQVIQLAYEDSTDPFDLLEFAERSFFEINQNIEEIKTVHKDHAMINVAREFEERRASAGKPELEEKYLRSGMKAWDSMNGYFRGGKIYTVAARPGMGKTDFFVQMICNMAKTTDVGFISAEMTDEEITQRIISNQAELDNEVWIKAPELINEDDQKRLFFGMQYFYNLKLHIEAKTNRIDRIANRIKFWVRKLGVKIVLIDYLQILSMVEDLSKYMTDVQILNYILEVIRTLAKELNIPIILLSQLNRAMYQRGNKEPGLGDLKGSGKIEEVSYQISFLHRPEYYDENATTDELGESTKGLCYQIIQKYRGGRTGRVKHLFVPKFSKFDDWDRGLPGGFNPMAGTTSFYTSSQDGKDLKGRTFSSDDEDPF